MKEWKNQRKCASLSDEFVKLIKSFKMNGLPILRFFGRGIIFLEIYLLCLSISISADSVQGKLISVKRLESKNKRLLKEKKRKGVFRFLILFYGEVTKFTWFFWRRNYTSYKYRRVNYAILPRLICFSYFAIMFKQMKLIVKTQFKPIFLILLILYWNNKKILTKYWRSLRRRFLCWYWENWIRLSIFYTGSKIIFDLQFFPVKFHLSVLQKDYKVAKFACFWISCQF